MLPTIKEVEVKETAEHFPIFLLYIISTKCPACEAFKESLKDIRNLHKDIPMRQINVFDAEDLAIELGVDAVPTVAIFSYGEYIGGGATSNKDAILALITHLKEADDELYR